MLKLYGVPFSNYYNMVKCALLEKGIDFEEVVTRPSQEADYLAKSAMGKVPCIETEKGFLAETLAILDYLEDAYPEHPLLPADPFERAKVRELSQSLALYLELVARRGFGVLRGMEVPDSVKDVLKTDLPKGAAAIAKLTRFSPWIAGDDFTYADLVGYFTFIYAVRSADENIGFDLYEAIPGSKAWSEKLAGRDSIKKALADQS